MIEIKQSTASTALVFFMRDSTDHVTGKTGLSPTVLISKNGGTFATPAGSVAAMGNGFYYVVPNTADTNTLGILALTATAAGADQATMAFAVVANLESDTYTRLAATPPTAAGIATQVRTELGTELGRIDASISSRNATTPPDATAIQAAAAAALTAYDPPTRTEATADKDEIIAALPDAAPDATAIQAAAAAALTAYDPPTRTESTADKDQIIAALPDAAPDATAIQAAAAAALTAYDPPTRAEATNDKDAIIAALPSAAPSAATIADAVWEEVVADHSTAGTTGAAIAASGAAGDPWATVVPASYADGTAGAAIGRLNNTPAESPIVILPDASADADLSIVYFDSENFIGVAVEDIEVEFHLSGATPQKTASGKIVENTKALATTDADGRLQISLERGLTYLAKSSRLFGGKGLLFTVPDEDTFNLASEIA